MEEQKVRQKTYTLKEFCTITGFSYTKANQLANARYGGFYKINGKGRWLIDEDTMLRKYHVNLSVPNKYSETEDENFRQRVHEVIYDFFKDVLGTEELKRVIYSD